MAKRECRYVFPIKPTGVASYVSSHHDYPATDINAPAGTPVVSPVDGTIDFIARTDSWLGSNDDPARRGGLSVAIIGEDGVRYYGSHLLDLVDVLRVGARVEAGGFIGRVGTSGNARGTSPHLHFGISKPTTPDDWMVRRGQVSPYPYLNAWKEGSPLTPDVPGARAAKCRVRTGGTSAG